MAWIQRNAALNDVSDIVMSRTGMNLNDLEQDNRNYQYPNMKEAAELLKSHMQENHKICVYGDYDADGITSLFELATLFDALSYKNVTLIAPHRFTDGYGINVARVRQFFKDGCSLLITIDNGVAAIDAIKLARDLGMDVLILDHHEPFVDESKNVILPDATVLVDPHVTGGADLGDHVFDDLCGAGIGLYFVQEVLKLTNFSAEKKERIINECTIAAGIGTVADVVKLVDDNRRIVKNALKLIKDGTYLTAGIRGLLEVLNIENPNSIDIAFGVAPCLNASGRIYDDGAQTMVSLLSFREVTPELDSLCKQAKEANDERKEMTARAVERAEDMMLERGNDSVIVLLDKDCSSGVAGLVASELTETYYRPSIVLTQNASGICKGSGRSIKEVDLKALLDQCQDKLLGYGGHPMAAGVSLLPENIDAFREAICAIAPLIPMPEDTFFDIEMEPEKDALMKLLKEINRFEPYGEGNESLKICIKGIELGDSMGNTFRTMGSEKDHVKFLTKYGFDIVWFHGLGEYKLMNKPTKIDIIGTLGLNTFRGNTTLQVQIDHCRPAM